MSQYELIAPCHFGMEAVLKREIQDLGYQIIKTEDGKVTFAGDESAFARANLFLRTAERVLWKVGSFRAETFEELFEGTKNLPWEEYLPPDAKFWAAKATSIRSRLFSSSDIQSIVKKAIVERMKFKYRMEWFPESGSEFPLRVSLLKDEVTIGIDTSGESLHKRGYRRLTSRAPLTETLAAAIIMLTPWKQDRLLVDPFCGSGTIPIEAAMIGANIAPGLNRSFTAKGWSDILPEKIWTQAAEEANDRIRRDIEMNIQGYDIDKDIVAAARKNAKLAGVEQYIHFQQRELVNLQSSRKYGFIITNPPYGERLEDKASMPLLYRQIGQAFRGLDSWSMYLLTAYEEAERYIGRKANKNRKIYNGMLKTYLYQFLGPKPLRSGAQR